MSELFDAVDALVASRATLPPPAERKRLRAAHGLTIDEVAGALKVRRATVSGWESGKTEPRPPERDAYARLLDQLAELYPAPSALEEPDAPAVPTTFTAAPAPAEARTLSTGPAPEAADMTATENTQTSPAPVAAALEAAPRPAGTSRSTSTSRRPAVRKAAPAGTPAGGTDPRFENGPLAVIDVEDGQVLAYCTGGLVLDVPAKSIPALVDWTLREAKLGQPKLSGPGKDADPLIVLTEAALERYGLPVALTDEERLAGRIPEGHKVIKQLVRAEWKLTKRGFGPWARIYRPAQGSERACVQLCIPSWNALDTRHWGEAGQLPPAELARVLGVYASRVMTPRGSTAVTGLELMTALHPPTRASEPDESGKRHSEHNPGSLGKDPVDCAPCEAPDGHPLLKDLPRFHVRGPAEKLFEEAYDWARPMTDAECTLRHLVGIDVNMAFAAGANGLAVGLGAPTHVTAPVFDAKLPGSWLVDLSHVDLSRVKVGKDKWVDLDASLLPSPFTPKGDRPEGPAWYATPTVAYAAELGYDVTPVEAYVRYENGRYLDGWYNRLRDAYLATMADLGVHADLSPADFLAAMDGYKERDPELAIVVSAIKATVKGGLGKLRERPRGEGWRPGEPWRALSRPTWRPDIRAAVISRTRINLHRKIVKHAAFTGQYPVAILSDCVVYAAGGEGPLDFLPYRDGKPLPGGFKLGINPGLVKHEGTQSVLWGEEVRERFDAPELNLARYIKDGTVTDADNGE
ncbi:transcriptional regulator [Streptomyces avermitilis]|uniref:Telomere-associated protein n=1 Tax=Streptomyces avermitilis (strain ATCC 31267 / DSM 46492 / JCM 5070 / NBRC 14893 / NCIMB 12804 / NRRL 8165 / MA-4680) TaxID=227882 RepID=Q824Z3_STRAW|nr:MULTISPECIES: helix-turn-helix transcriptional regulator [Streptomyces]KUN45813.1 transcriptional regulator [Streptomyces avermitilis]MYT03093.1 helix-turn-helix domain-containing protein [Streptomyces sp. SID5469]BAC75278.2 putative telomere-associated protein [Streptomyces avermitilis MA-4680 = NBRC 14893]BAU77692.1 putative telomere-associated protein [Streptomyces avermitilis MA-4680 = NBRC 14893]